MSAIFLSDFRRKALLSPSGSIRLGNPLAACPPLVGPFFSRELTSPPSRSSWSRIIFACIAGGGGKKTACRSIALLKTRFWDRRRHCRSRNARIPGPCIPAATQRSRLDRHSVRKIVVERGLTSRFAPGLKIGLSLSNRPGRPPLRSARAGPRNSHKPDRGQER